MFLRKGKLVVSLLGAAAEQKDNSFLSGGRLRWSLVGEPAMDSAHRLTATHMREWLWSRAEKTAARHAFDVALVREFEAVIREAQERTARIADREELWELERWLAARRREINRTYDFRYSVLPQVFAQLLRLGRLKEEELDGLAPDKLDVIRRIRACY
jgi:Photoprotection regulator fluorescence recovery protein